MTVLFLIICIAFLFILNTFVLKNQTVKSKIFISIGAILIFFAICILILMYLWNNSGGPKKEEVNDFMNYKNIKLINEGKTTRYGLLTYQFIIDSRQINDTLHIRVRPNDTSKVSVYKKLNDSTSFLKNFNLKIQDSLHHTLVEYNAAAFLEKCSTEPVSIKSGNKLRANSWVLKINQ